MGHVHGFHVVAGLDGLEFRHQIQRLERYALFLMIRLITTSV